MRSTFTGNRRISIMMATIEEAFFSSFAHNQRLVLCRKGYCKSDTRQGRRVKNQLLKDLAFGSFDCLLGVVLNNMAMVQVPDTPTRRIVLYHGTRDRYGGKSGELRRIPPGVAELGIAVVLSCVDVCSTVFRSCSSTVQGPTSSRHQAKNTCHVEVGFQDRS
jgi:hypothetical protein